MAEQSTIIEKNISYLFDKYDLSIQDIFNSEFDINQKVLEKELLGEFDLETN